MNKKFQKSSLDEARLTVFELIAQCPKRVPPDKKKKGTNPNKSFFDGAHLSLLVLEWAGDATDKQKLKANVGADIEALRQARYKVKGSAVMERALCSALSQLDMPLEMFVDKVLAYCRARGLKIHGLEDQLDGQSIEENHSNHKPARVSNLPRRHSRAFLGRADELSALDEKLREAEGPYICIHGMGGVGKSEVARQYALASSNEYEVVCWIDIRSQPNIELALLNFAEDYLSWNKPEELPIGRQISQMWQYWQSQGYEKTLIVFDDISDYAGLAGALPPGDERFRCVVTSRLTPGAGAAEIEITTLDEQESIELLRVLAGKKALSGEPDTVARLCKRLGYLPLALHLVGAYLSVHPLVRLAQLELRLEENGLEDSALGSQADSGIQSVLQLSWEDLSSTGKQLACRIALCSAGMVHWPLVEACYSKEDTSVAQNARDEELARRHLLELGDESCIEIHPLVHDFFVVKFNLYPAKEELRQAFFNVLVAAATGFPQHASKDDIESFSPAVSATKKFVQTILDGNSNQDGLWLCTTLGRYFEGIGSFDEAIFWHQKSIEIGEQFKGEELKLLTSKNNLAVALYLSGNWAEARGIHENVLKTRLKLLPKEHPDVLESKSNLAIVMTLHGAHDSALALCREVFNANTESLGPLHRATLVSLNNVGSALLAKGDLEQAKSTFGECLKIRTETLGRNDPQTITSINNLGRALTLLGEHEDALRIFKEALQLSASTFGKDHLTYAHILFNYGQLDQAMENIDSAKQHYLGALDIRARKLDEDHPSTMAARDALAQIEQSN